LVLLTAILALAISSGLLWAAKLYRGISSWDGFRAAALLLGYIIFHVLLELGHRLAIRLFFRRRKVRILRIRGFRNHYRVDYDADGQRMSGKWPKDFENWLS
jgi:hypothetical protein